MTEDIALRFTLVHELSAMPYGEARQFTAKIVDRAWPPTGDEDRSFEGAFRAMALAFGGHRPETSMTSEERILYDLSGEGGFEVRRERNGDVTVFRRLSACPHCHGRGWAEVHIPPAVSELVSDAQIDPTGSVITRQRKRCDHKPLPS